ncbi:MAG TPA: hypothetical protein RMH85_30170 [Polyangiaceae bacterium LLY-WYZ-15_(1-7)]|nr:hypothetical protein [Myxococcales bacterium]MAT29274.1 hypothetical protein [Sandaracinus sp.]HJL05476.1 hypothetical protein [Polyangiaceae bacterium LLY-WYZ-15_(1-7)]MBJ73262.1 hypothetical protein [Sandaracinus sp.]HJL12787.1 hypothetical protein [Polyangiaceae bacterium LLY-WYZ-15_(1-7)]
MSGPTRWALLAAVLLFIVFLVVKSRVALVRDPDAADARRRLGDARQRARQADKHSEARADAYLEAARIALDDLGRPRLAASYARRADRARPERTEGLRLVVRAMRRAERHRALERLLWRRLDEVDLEGERAERIFAELQRLYEGPLRRPAQARVLRQLWENGRGAASTSDEA